MSNDIAGKVAWVTGASSGLGHRFAQVLAGAGAIVALSARRTDRLEALAAEIATAGGRALAVPLDMAEVPAIYEAAARIERELGPIDILVNNAGLSRQARLEAFTEADYDAVLDVDLKGPFFAAQAAARQMIAHTRPGADRQHRLRRRIPRARASGGAYSVAKAGLVSLTRCQAREWGRHGINANAICPGYIRTEMGGDFWETEGAARLIASLPRKRLGEPRDLDGLLLLLCSFEASRFINGTAMVAERAGRWCELHLLRATARGGAVERVEHFHRAHADLARRGIERRTAETEIDQHVERRGAGVFGVVLRDRRDDVLPVAPAQFQAGALHIQQQHPRRPEQPQVELEAAMLRHGRGTRNRRRGAAHEAQRGGIVVIDAGGRGHGERKHRLRLQVGDAEQQAERMHKLAPAIAAGTRRIGPGRGWRAKHVLRGLAASAGRRTGHRAARPCAA